jgi:hypothetical protein
LRLAWRRYRYRYWIHHNATVPLDGLVR